MMNLFQTIRTLVLAGIFFGCGAYGLHYVFFGMIRPPDVSPTDHMRAAVTYAVGCAACLLLALFLLCLVLLQSEPLRRAGRWLEARRKGEGEEEGE